MRCGEPVAAKRVLPLQEFQIWLDGEAEEERTRGQAVDFRGAALGFAHDTDDDHRIAKGRPVTLNIMDGAGRVERWRVTGELIPQYEAAPAPAVPPGSCPDGVACIMAPGHCAARGRWGRAGGWTGGSHGRG